MWFFNRLRIYKNASLVEMLAGHEEDFPRFHGLGLSFGNGLEVYADPEMSTREVRRIINEIIPNVEVRVIQCAGFNVYRGMLRAGDAVSHINLYASGGFGTLGGFALDMSSPYLLAISNNHVLAECNMASVGDDLVHFNSGNIFGKLHRFVPLKMPPLLNEVDAAVGWIYENYRFGRLRLGSGAGSPVRGMRVYKLGARTGYTEGVIAATAVATVVNYGDLGFLNFRRCLRIEGLNGPFSEPGDSRSLVISMGSKKVVGLLFAGEAEGRYSLANSATLVECQMGVVF